MCRIIVWNGCYSPVRTYVCSTKIFCGLMKSNCQTMYLGIIKKYFFFCVGALDFLSLHPPLISCHFIQLSKQSEGCDWQLQFSCWVRLKIGMSKCSISKFHLIECISVPVYGRPQGYLQLQTPSRKKREMNKVMVINQVTKQVSLEG